MPTGSMPATEQLALSAAFIAAVVVAGVALSLVPNVELITLTVFAAGVLLGPSAGARVGATGMLLYVLANSALRGFPVSPIPLLLAQMAGMGITGWAGGAWRRAWTRGGRARRGTLLVLPAVGVACVLVYQVLTNVVSAFLFRGDEQAFVAFVVAGLAFGLVQVVVNAALFAVAAPGIAVSLRRLARDRGWWGRPGAALVLLGLLVVPARAQVPADPAAAAVDTAGTVPAAVAPGDTAVADTTVADTTAPDRVVPPPMAVPGRLRPLDARPDPVWETRPACEADETGQASYLSARPVAWVDPARTTSLGLHRMPAPWSWGWGRTETYYDGLPLNGPVHGFAEPPDVPLAWYGDWTGRASAAGADLHLAAPPRLIDRPRSQISLSTGSRGIRTVEFSLFRNLGPVNLGANLADLEQGSDFVLSDLDATRFRVHLDAAGNRRPNWSFDWSDGNRRRNLLTGQRYVQNSRRIQASLRGPFLGGETRISGQYRRQAVKVEGQEEVRFDGGTLQAEWAAPAGFTLTGRADRDRRRGGSPAGDRTLDGARGTLAWGGEALGFRLGADATAGYQEPFGRLLEGTVAVTRDLGAVAMNLSVAHEEGLPALVDAVDRPLPEAGMATYLEAVETAENPEGVSAVRLSGTFTRDRFHLELGGWAGRQTHYLIESNPLWAPDLGSPYRPLTAVDRTAEVAGAWAEIRLPLVLGFRAEGRGRVDSRPRDQVPFHPSWDAGGAIHWQGMLFKESLDLDLELGGILYGERRTPGGEEYSVEPLSYAKATARVDNGSLTFLFDNLVDRIYPSDFRAQDATTPLLGTTRSFRLFLTLYLLD